MVLVSNKWGKCSGVVVIGMVGLGGVRVGRVKVVVNNK